MRKYLFSILSVVFLLLGSQCLDAQKLVIIHTNDTHSHLDPSRTGEGGVIERAAYVDEVRKEAGKRNVLLLHAGDFNQGTSYFTILNGDLEVDLVNALGYDCVTLGNHEFDNGLEDLARRVKKLECPVVCANYDFSPFELGQYVKPCTIIRKAGMKIGIIGVICNLTSVVSRATADRLPKLDTVEEVNKWSSYLKNEKKCDMVIVLSHLGYKSHEESDVNLIPQTHYVDLLVGGHSHTDFDDLDYVEDADGKSVPIISDGSWGLNLGRIEVY